MAPTSSAPLPSVESPSSKQDVARALIEDALAPVMADLERLSRKLSGYLPTETKAGRQVIDYILSAGGKRIRPALFYLSSRIVGYDGEHLDPIAAVGEFVHTASILHDDVVDNSTLRRGRPTSNSIWGDETSVLVGDLIYSTASEMMAATGNIEIVRTFARAIRLMSDGELLQLENLFNPEMSEATYLRVLECKTAILIESVCRSAGLLGGADAKVTDALSCFGHSVGMAFQLIDDALDYTAAAEVLGKQTLADLPEGKVTLPVILARELATPAERQAIRDAILSDPVGPAEVGLVRELVDKYDTAQATVERARAFTEQAMDSLSIFPRSQALQDLENLATKLLYRFN